MKAMNHMAKATALALMAIWSTPQVTAADMTPPETFDVAEDHTRFVFDQSGPLHDDGMPAYGNAFVTQGYIYPERTLDGADGVTRAGEPEFPDEVIGEWTCYGYFVGDGAPTDADVWVVTTQIYDFGGEHVGKATLVSHGYERNDDVPFKRPITGGTGPYRGADGFVEQRSLGFHGHDGVKLRFAVEESSRTRFRPSK
jgi:hypothetical protein